MRPTLASQTLAQTFRPGISTLTRTGLPLVSRQTSRGRSWMS